MQPTKSDGTDDGTHDGIGIAKRLAWRRPALTVLAIGPETKSSRRDVAKSDGSSPAEPQPPAAPATKLGFSLEWAFPLSARLEK
jgi:hypothetical protein